LPFGRPAEEPLAVHAAQQHEACRIGAQFRQVVGVAANESGQRRLQQFGIGAVQPVAEQRQQLDQLSRIGTVHTHISRHQPHPHLPSISRMTTTCCSVPTAPEAFPPFLGRLCRRRRAGNVERPQAPAQDVRR